MTNPLNPPATSRYLSRQLSARDRALITAILIAAAFLRLAFLTRVPPGLHFDEAVYGLLAEDIRQGARPIFFGAYTGREPLFMYAIALLSTATGPSAFVIRLTSALTGTVTVALAFCLGRAFHGRRVGMATAAFVAVSYWHLTVSRNGYPNVLIPPLEAAAALALWRGWVAGSKRAWIVGGALSGIVLYTYLAARLWPVFLALLIVTAALSHGERYRLRRTGVALGMLAGLAVLMPLLVHFALTPSDFWERADQVLAHRQLSGGALVATYASHALRSLQAIAWPGFGDPRWHFNLPGRPMWSLPTAVLLAVGAAIALRSARDLRFAAPLLWVAVMALPGLLTLEMQPAGQRMFGVFPAIAMLPAIGMAWLAERTRLRFAWPLLFIGVIAWEGGATIRDYFGGWATATEVAATYHADHLALAQLGREALNAGQPLVILSEHYRHPTVAFAEPGVVEAAIWADPRRALPIGRSEVGTLPTVYLVPEPLLHKAPLAEAWLESEASARNVFEVVDGRAIEGGVAENTRAGGGDGSPDGPLRVLRFEVPASLRSDIAVNRSPNGTAVDPALPNLAGELVVFEPGSASADLSTVGGTAGPTGGAGGGATESDSPLRRDRPVTVTLRVQVIKQPPAGVARSLSLRLLDSLGLIRQQVDQIGIVPTDWRGPGLEFLQFFTFEASPTIPPERYGLSLRYAGQDAEALPVQTLDGAAEEMRFQATLEFGSEGRERVDPLSVTPLLVLSPQESVDAGGDDAPPWSLPGLAVIDAQMLTDRALPGDHAEIEVQWARTDGPAPAGNRVTISLEHDGRSHPLGSQPLARDYPPGSWSRLETLTARYKVEIPEELEGGRYDVSLSIQGLNGQLHAGTLDIERISHVFDSDAPAIELGAVFEILSNGAGPPTKIELLGFEANPWPIDGGSGASIVIQWRADRTLDRDLKVFVHLVDPAGRLIAQDDSEPAQGQRPTRTWTAREIIVDPHLLATPGQQGPFTLAIGLYDPLTGERMPIVEGFDRGASDRAVRAPLPDLAGVKE